MEFEERKEYLPVKEFEFFVVSVVVFFRKTRVGINLPWYLVSF